MLFSCITSTLKRIAPQIVVVPQLLLGSVNVDGVLGSVNYWKSEVFSHDNSDTLKHWHIGNGYTRILMQ